MHSAQAQITAGKPSRRAHHHRPRSELSRCAARPPARRSKPNRHICSARCTCARQPAAPTCLLPADSTHRARSTSQESVARTQAHRHADDSAGCGLASATWRAPREAARTPHLKTCARGRIASLQSAFALAAFAAASPRGEHSRPRPQCMVSTSRQPVS